MLEKCASHESKFEETLDTTDSNTQRSWAQHPPSCPRRLKSAPSAAHHALCAQKNPIIQERVLHHDGCRPPESVQVVHILATAMLQTTTAGKLHALRLESNIPPSSKPVRWVMEHAVTNKPG